MIKTFWGKLDAKQRKLVAGAAIFVLIALILEIAVFPFWEAKAKLTKAIQVNQKKLNEMSKLDAEFTLQEAAMSKIKKITINKMKESPEYLSAQLQISSFQTLSQQQRGK